MVIIIGIILLGLILYKSDQVVLVIKEYDSSREPLARLTLGAFLAFFIINLGVILSINLFLFWTLFMAKLILCVFQSAVFVPIILALRWRIGFAKLIDGWRPGREPITWADFPFVGPLIDALFSYSKQGGNDADKEVGYHNANGLSRLLNFIRVQFGEELKNDSIHTFRLPLFFILPFSLMGGPLAFFFTIWLWRKEIAKAYKNTRANINSDTLRLLRIPLIIGLVIIGIWYMPFSIILLFIYYRVKGLNGLHKSITWLNALLSAALVAAFFMDWAFYGPWDVLFGDLSRFVSSPVKWLMLLIPTSATIIILGTLNKVRYLVNPRFLYAVPLLTLVVVSLIMGTDMVDIYDELPRQFRPKAKDVFSSLGIGFWITFVASIALLFLGLTTDFTTQSRRSVHHGADPIVDKTPTIHSRKQEQEQSIPLEELEKLAKMKEAGHITEEEFQELKRDLLKKTT